MRPNKLTATLAAAALSTTMMVGVAAPAANAAPKAGTGNTQLVTAAPIDISVVQGAVSFVGQLTPTRFTTVDGQLALVGTLTGTATNTLTGATETVNETITAVISGASAGGSCQILELDLGPLFLDVLGLQIDLSRIQLDITAVRGAGNLLGNLLCSVAGLLDGPNDGGLARLLNRLLGH